MSDELLIRTSERVTFTRCPQKWKWAWVDCLTPIRVAPALRFGDLVHQALATYYKPGKKRGVRPATTFKKIYEANLTELESLGMRTESGDWEKAYDLGIEMLHGYVDKYGKDERYEVIAPEMPFQIDVYDPKTNLYICTYVGTFDAVIRDLWTNEIGLFEHKTAKAIYTAHLTLDEQAGSYWAFAPDFLKAQGVLKEDENLDFVLYNFLRKGMPDQRPQNEKGQYLNKDGSVSRIQPPPLFKREIVYRGNAERRNTMLRVIKIAKLMKKARGGRFPIYKIPTRDCSWQCEFVDMCELHESGGDWQSLKRSTMTKWDPYEAHEEKGGEE